MQEIGFDYKHTRYPLDQDGVLSDTLGIPVSRGTPEVKINVLQGFLPAPDDDEQYPETTFGVKFLTQGYFEKKPAALANDYGSLLDSPQDIQGLLVAVRKGIAKWEHERSSQVIHRSDGLERFLKKVQSNSGQRSGSVSQKDRNKWKEDWVEAFAKGSCSNASSPALEAIPYFQLKPPRSFSLCAVLESLSSCECPLVRASWFIKVTCLKNQLEEHSNQRYNRRSPADTTLSGRSTGGPGRGKASALTQGTKSTIESKEKIHRMRAMWTLHFLDYLKSKIWDIAEYKVDKKAGYPSQYRPVYANMVKSTKKRPLTPSTKQPSPKPVINEKKLHQFNYACRLARWQFDEGLFIKSKFLDDLLDIMENMRNQQTQRRKPGLPLSLCCSIVAYILEYVDSMSLRHIERLWFICTKQLCQLLWTGSSNEDSLYFDANFQPLCTLLRLGLHSASSLGKQNVSDWEEKIYGVQRKQSEWNPIHRIMKRLSSSSTSATLQGRTGESKAQDSQLKPGFFTGSGEGVVLDFSKARYVRKPKAWHDPWIRIEKVPNTKALFNMLSKARKLKRVAS